MKLLLALALFMIAAFGMTVSLVVTLSFIQNHI